MSGLERRGLIHAGSAVHFWPDMEGAADTTPRATQEEVGNA